MEILNLVWGPLVKVKKKLLKKMKGKIKIRRKKNDLPFIDNNR